jgi:SNF2 family DNA or RNA helicase
VKFKGELYSYQVEAKQFALKNRYSICSLEMGLGKTIVALSAIADTAKRALIICPAFLKQNWYDEASKFVDDYNLHIISYSQLHKLDLTDQFDFVVCDEAHYIKNPKAKRSQRVFNYIKANSHIIKHVMLLTGTPIKNRVPDIWSLLSICHLGGQYTFPYHRLYMKFCETFCYERSFEINGTRVIKYEGIKKAKIPELKEILKPVYFRRRISDVSLNLPKQIRKNLNLPINKPTFNYKLQQIFDENGVGEVKSAAFASVKAGNALVKTKFTVDLAKDIIEQGSKVVIFTDHVASAQDIASHLNCTAITGELDVDTRNIIVASFKNQESSRVIVETTGALSVGVNLTVANYMIFNDIPWVPSDIAQAEKRIPYCSLDF